MQRRFRLGIHIKINITEGFAAFGDRGEHYVLQNDRLFPAAHGKAHVAEYGQLSGGAFHLLFRMFHAVQGDVVVFHRYS